VIGMKGYFIIGIRKPGHKTDGCFLFGLGKLRTCFEDADLFDEFFKGKLFWQAAEDIGADFIAGLHLIQLSLENGSVVDRVLF